jgi:carbon monoxide dehydrogenase subunit G
MASGQAEISVNVSPDDAWKLLRGFGTLAEWMPGIESCTVEGDVRTLGMMGIEVKEQLRDLDDDARRIAYSVIESPMDNLESHLATIAVRAEGAGSHITYSVEVVPDELLGLFLPMYEGALRSIKSRLEA